MTRKSTPPTTKATAFDCPYCGAFTTQHWFILYAEEVGGEPRLPLIPSEEFLKGLERAKIEPENKERFKAWSARMQGAEVFFEQPEHGKYLYQEANNLFLSHCYNCHKIAVWVHQSLVFPAQRVGPEPNADLPEEILRDVEEARTILNLSPRGAAALLRLCVQKLCATLGERGKNIDDDIASLVAKGLNPTVQKSLDVVRVIGNEAVHPGVIDLRDDRDTGIQLLTLVNIIAEQMISQPKMIDDLYEKLPEGKKQAIQERDQRASTKPPRG